MALLEVPLDEEEFTRHWGALVKYCNIYGTKPTNKHREGFSSFPDPHNLHPSTIPASVHGYLNKLWNCRRQ